MANQTVFEISTDARFEKALTFIKQKIKNEKHLSKIIRKKERTYLIITANKNIVPDLHSAITQVVITTMKNYYLTTHTSIPNIPSINREAFIRALSLYDEKTDTIIAGAMVKITPRILLDGLYDFALAPLRKRWSEVAKLVNENMLNLLSKSMFDELLRFLISNLDHKINEAHIIKNNKKIMICNDELTPFDIAVGNSDMNIINALIDISPKTIFIHANGNDIEKKLIKSIEQIFPRCVTISVCKH
ncbi:MAG: putative sporulation protein YtxC [Christensenellaceae bacterium]|jgi:hypothetical protein|nr:putative sporulation protein YtxC [Christensenellaceae bacterium]